MIVVHSLECRRLFDAFLNGNILTVTGTSNGDDMRLTQTPAGQLLEVRINDQRHLFDIDDIKQMRISGLGGDDVIEMPQEFISAGSAIDDITITISGGGGDDSIIGRTDKDTIYGGRGNDTIDCHGGYGLYAGGAGRDLLIIGLTGSGAFHGGPGNDTIQASGNSESVQGDSGIDSLDFGHDNYAHFQVSFDGVDNDGRVVVAGDGTRALFGEMHVLGDFEVLIGGPLSDELTGDDSFETILGGGGNDSIHGGAGDDVIRGGAGHDKLFGDAGADTLTGSEGRRQIQLRDTLDGGGDDGDFGDDVPPDLLRGLSTT